MVWGPLTPIFAQPYFGGAAERSLLFAIHILIIVSDSSRLGATGAAQNSSKPPSIVFEGYLSERVSTTSAVESSVYYVFQRGEYRGTTALAMHQTTLPFYFDYRELDRFSDEVNIFNSLPLKQQEEFILNTIIMNKAAFNAFKENIDVLQEVDIFKFDPNRILRIAKVCTGM